MNGFILCKNQTKVKKLFIFFSVLAIGFGDERVCHPKYWEYTEIVSGTIYNVKPGKPNPRWWAFLGILNWVNKIGLVMVGAFFVGLLGPPLVWVLSMLTIRKTLMWLSVISGRHLWLRDLAEAIAGHCFMAAFIGAVFLGLGGADASRSYSVMNVLPIHCASVANAEQVFSEQLSLIRQRYRISVQDQIRLYQELCKDQQVTTPELLSKFPHIGISAGQLNRIRKEWGLSRERGRPGKVPAGEVEKIQSASCFPKTGVYLFAKWLKNDEQYQQSLKAVYMHIEQYQREHPKENFRLLHARKETIAQKWLALHLLPLLGIAKLSELNYKQHDLATVIGNFYSTSSLSQFLGELERVALGVTLRNVLNDGAKGDFCYIDGHMIAFWTSLKMHKGHITMLGRIMAGSKAVLAHNETGQVIGLEYHPPDIHLGQVIEDYCRNIVERTGIRRFIIDREINSVNTARLFTRRGWGLICLLDANEYKGMESFNKKYAGKLDDGTKLYRGFWEPARKKDPRYFIIAQEQERCLVYWCTVDIAKQFTAQQIVTFYRKRAEIQENSIKRMIAHGALNTNYGTKKVWSLDRSHHRKMDKLEAKTEKLCVKRSKLEQQEEEQMLKIQESIEKNHDSRFETRMARLRKMEDQESELNAQIQAVEVEKRKIGSPCLKADRDFRKQTIMTCRTLFLENALRKFTSLISTFLKTPVDVEVILNLFFLRRGACVETEQKISYFLDSSDLSQKYRYILKDIVEGCNHIFLNSKGKPISLELAGMT